MEILFAPLVFLVTTFMGVGVASEAKQTNALVVKEEKTVVAVNELPSKKMDKLSLANVNVGAVNGERSDAVMSDDLAN